MRKVIVISVIFAALLGFAVWEIIYSTRLYNNIYDGLVEVEQSIIAHEENIAEADTLELMDKVMNDWKKGKNTLFCLGNHIVLRSVDEKLVALEAMVRINYRDDALVTVSIAKETIKAILNDSHPVPTNLF